MGLPTKNPNVIFRRVDEGAVLLSAKDEVYFGLNEVGAVIWEALTPDLETTDSIKAVLVEKYPDVDPDVIATDLDELLAELVKAGMLLTNENPEAAP